MSELKKNSMWARAAVAAVGALMMAGVAGAAFADDVDLSVTITEVPEPGALALTVAPGDVELEEEGSTASWRQFTGDLPQVTVTDTRDATDITPGAFWYVVGTSSDFVGDSGQPDITADHLGWEPELITSSGSGLVAAGDRVDTVMDIGPDAVGLVDEEFLVSASDSGSVLSEGSWTAGADLFLRTPVDVEPGEYTATLTLSLFE